MPVKNYLKTDEKQKLQNELKYNEHPDMRERMGVSQLGMSINT